MNGKIIYSGDLEESARRLAQRYLYRFVQNNPANYDSYEALFRHVFLPKALVLLTGRLKGRGYKIVDGKNPTERSSSKRAKDKFIRAVKYAIESASIRLDSLQ